MKLLRKIAILLVAVALLAAPLAVSAADYQPDFDYLIGVFEAEDGDATVKLAKGEKYSFESFWGLNGGRFFSSDEIIAGVEQNGTVTAHNVGTAYIVAISSTKSQADMIKVIVSEVRETEAVTEKVTEAPDDFPHYGDFGVEVEQDKVAKEDDEDEDKGGNGYTSPFSHLRNFVDGNGGGFSPVRVLGVIVPLFIAGVVIFQIAGYFYSAASYKKNKKKTVERNAEIDAVKIAYAELEAAPSDESVCKLAYELELLKKKGSKSPIYSRNLITLYRTKVFDNGSIKEESKLRLKKAMASHGISGIDPLRSSAPDPMRAKIAEMKKRYGVVKAEMTAFPNEENALKFLAFMTEIKDGEVSLDKITTNTYYIGKIYNSYVDNNADITENTRMDIKKVLASLGISGLGETKIHKIEEKKHVSDRSKPASPAKSGKVYDSGEAYGQAGEDNAWFQLCEVCNTGKFNAFSSVRLPYSGNSQAHSQEIDAIVVCHKGVFLMEIKSYSHKKVDENDESVTVTYDDVLLRDAAVATQISAHKNAFFENFQIDSSKVRSLLVMSYPKDSYKEIDISTFPRDDSFYSLKVSEVFEYLTKYDGPDVLNDAAIDLISHGLTKYINKKDGKPVTKWVIDKKAGKPSKDAEMPELPAKKFCPECGTENRSEAVCCRSCGHKFE